MCICVAYSLAFMTMRLGLDVDLYIITSLLERSGINETKIRVNDQDHDQVVLSKNH